MDPLAARLLVAFLAGGATVALFTLAAERLGSRVGGLLLSFPVKVAITLVLVALQDGPALAAAAAAVAPAGLAANVAFLTVAVLVLRAGRGLGPALAAGLVAWVALAAPAVLLLPPALAWTVPPFLVASAVAFRVLSRDRAHRGSRREKPKPGRFGIVGRAAFAGVVVASAVLVTSLLGPGPGGVMSVFPSGFLTSVVILYRAQGSAFTAMTARTMVVGLLAPALYLALVALTYPVLHLALATALAIGAAVAVSAAVGATLEWVDRREVRAAGA